MVYTCAGVCWIRWGPWAPCWLRYPGRPTWGWWSPPILPVGGTGTPGCRWPQSRWVRGSGGLARRSLPLKRSTCEQSVWKNYFFLHISSGRISVRVQLFILKLRIRFTGTEYWNTRSDIFALQNTLYIFTIFTVYIFHYKYNYFIFVSIDK